MNICCQKLDLKIHTGYVHQIALGIKFLGQFYCIKQCLEHILASNVQNKDL